MGGLRTVSFPHGGDVAGSKAGAAEGSVRFCRSGFSRELCLGPSPCGGRGRLGGGCHGSRQSQRHPSPALPCLRRGGSQGLAASADPARASSGRLRVRSEEHPSELQSLMCISFAVLLFYIKKVI